jgi:hypothetical protein
VSKGPASGIPAGGPGHGGPRRGYSWPPFPSKHGARSPRHVDPVAAELAAALLEDRPDLAGYPEAVMAWARAESRCILLADYHARVGFLDDDGQVRGGKHVAAFETQAANLRVRLGLDPLADAQLRKQQAEALVAATDLEGIRERGRAALERRRAQLAAVPGATPAPLPAPADPPEEGRGG